MTEISARREFTPSYSPDSDGVVERGHQTILKIADTLRISANLFYLGWTFWNSVPNSLVSPMSIQPW